MKKPNLTDKQLTELLKKAGKGFKLSESDKGIMRSELNDVIKSSSIRTNKRSITENIIKPRKLTMPLIPMIIAVVIAFGGGTAALADSAVPGDFLYPVDGWVEQIQEKFTKSEESWAVLHAQRVEERLRELGELGEIDVANLTDAQKTLLAENKRNLQERLNHRIERSQEAIDKLQAKFGKVNSERGKKGLERALGSLEEIGARQEIMIGHWKEPGFELPIMDEETRARLEAMRREHQQKMEELREKFREMVENGEIEWIAPEPINPMPEPMVDNPPPADGEEITNPVVDDELLETDDSKGDGFGGFRGVFEDLI